MSKRLTIIITTVYFLLVGRAFPSNAQNYRPLFLLQDSWKKVSVFKIKGNYTFYNKNNIFFNFQNYNKKNTFPVQVSPLIKNRYSSIYTNATSQSLLNLENLKKDLSEPYRFFRPSDIFRNHTFLEDNHFGSEPLPCQDQINHEESDKFIELVPVDNNEENKNEDDDFWKDYIFKLIIDYLKESDLDWSIIIKYGERINYTA